MFKRILIPTDGSSVARKAIGEGVSFARDLGASVVGYYAAEALEEAFNPESSSTRPAAVDEVRIRIAEQGELCLDEIAQACKAAGVHCETLMTVGTEPYLGIVDTARTKNCDIIFMASHGRSGLAALILGSVTQKVLAHSRIPVLVFR